MLEAGKPTRHDSDQSLFAARDEARHDAHVARSPSSNSSMIDGEAIGIVGRLRRQKLVFVSVFLLALVVVASVFTVLPRKYEGTASVIVLSPEPVLANSGPGLDQKLGDPPDLDSQAVVLASFPILRAAASEASIGHMLETECQIKSRSVLSRVLAAVSGPPDCQRFARDPDYGAAYLQLRVDIVENGRSRVIDVSYRSLLPDVAKAIPNTIVDQYIAKKLGDRLGSRVAAIAWLRTETARILEDLAKTESYIDRFRRENGLINGEVASFSAEQLTAVGQEIAAARSAQAQAAAKLDELKDSPADTPDVLNSRSISDIKQAVSAVEGQEANFSNSFGPSHPTLAGLEHQKTALLRQLDSETDRIKSSVRKEYAAATARVATLQQELDDAKRQVSAGAEADTKIANLQRHADVQRELYVDLSKKIDELEAERRVVSGNSQVVSHAQLPDTPAFPRKLPFVLGGLIVATGLAGGLSLMRDRNDATIRTKHGLQLSTGISVLGYIPALRGSRELTGCQEVHKPSIFQEAIRGLYAQCFLVHGSRRPRSILLTSADPGDGKTFLTLALAQFAAASGQRILAIEADMRRPDFQRALSLPQTHGLSDYLRGDASCEQIVYSSDARNLDIILAGKPATNSTELICNGRLEELLDWAASRYDLILIDSPPSQRLMDAPLLASRVDSVLFCARWGSSTSRGVSDAIHEVSRFGGRVAGVVIGRVNYEKLRFYDLAGPRSASYLPQAC